MNLRNEATESEVKIANALWSVREHIAGMGEYETVRLFHINFKATRADVLALLNVGWNYRHHLPPDIRVLLALKGRV